MQIQTNSSFQEGLNDVLRLSKGMTDKNNVASIPFGGGKAVIFKQGIKSKDLLKSFASFLNLLNGTYISAEDIGITIEDIIFIRKHTEHVFDNVEFRTIYKRIVLLNRASNTNLLL